MASKLLTTQSLRIPLYALAVYGTISLVEHSLFNIHPVTGSSMSPALSPSYHSTGARDVILVSKWRLSSSPSSSPRRITPIIHDLQRGDMVALWKPHDPHGRSIKRIIGLPGDVIVRRRSNSVIPTLEKNTRAARRLGFASVPERLTVPTGHVWVQGDNWRDSFDSNDYGTVPINMITGRAVRIVWPPARWGEVHRRCSDKTGGARAWVEEGKRPSENIWEVFNYD